MVSWRWSGLKVLIVSYEYWPPIVLATFYWQIINQNIKQQQCLAIGWNGWSAVRVIGTRHTIWVLRNGNRHNSILTGILSLKVSYMNHAHLVGFTSFGFPFAQTKQNIECYLDCVMLELCLPMGESPLIFDYMNCTLVVPIVDIK